jgi:serine/threonine-protein kinase
MEDSVMTMKPRVLFVDDEERIVNLLKIMFRQTYEVFTATNGHDALKIINDQRIHVIVSDQRMPEMLGIELLNEVRVRSPKTMRILLTGYSDLAAIVSSVNEGEVFRFVNKPWDQEEFRSLMAEATGIAQATEQNASSPTDLGVSPSAAVLTAAAKDKTLQRDILVIDGNEVDRNLTCSLLMLENIGHIHAKASIEEGLKVLEHDNVAVIVIDAFVGERSNVPFLNILKQQYPLITTVLATGSADADTIIKLINQAQIYRFVHKPLKHASFGIAVTAALNLHDKLRNDPKLNDRYRVAYSEEANSPSFATGLRNILTSLRERMKLFA